MNKISKVIFIFGLMSGLGMISTPVQAQLGIVEIIRQGIKRAIKAVDLKIQRLQNQAIWLQNAQKILENNLSKLKLSEIASWSDRQRLQYQKYYAELSQVKSLISQYQRLREISERQVNLVKEYRRVWQIIKSAGLYSPQEMEFMAEVYSGMLEESLGNVDRIGGIIGSFSLQMSDAARLALINQAADELQENYDALNRFNTENILLGLQRGKETRELKQLRWFYDLGGN
ncbi:MAG: conjugal transfer protein TraI [Sphingobacterium sp.]